jgi:L-ascorbate metabolism protein UlaG (beta-lactamase superfamily)
MMITLEWFGVATFRLTVGDLVLFLDAYMDRVPAAPPVGLRSEDVERCDFVLVGHSHFDHLHGAQHIAINTGAKVIGSNETARVLKGQGVPVTQLWRAQGGEHFRLSKDVTVRVYPGLHACTWVEGTIGVAEERFGHLGLCEDERLSVGGLIDEIRQAIGAGDEQAIQLRDHIATAAGSGDAGGPLAYLIQTPQGTVFYQDTSGCWPGVLADVQADVAILAASGRANLAGEPFQGSLAQFVSQEAAMLQPKTVILGHHDNWMPPVTRGSTDLTPVRQELRLAVPDASFLELGYNTPVSLGGST